MSLLFLLLDWHRRSLRDPIVLLFIPFALITTLAACLSFYTRNGKRLLDAFPQSVSDYVRFIYGCFLKPHEGGKSRDQKVALESFYKAPASVYDSTRMRLLKGREDMLGLVAAQIQWRVKTGVIPHKPIWVDIGGGTGYNIEQMQQFLDVPTFFEKIFLVDLSPSLTAVAVDRFIRLGWKNVVVVCQDARCFRLQDHYRPRSSSRDEEKAISPQPDLITMSYSLSMIPDFYSVVDSLANNLSENGIIGVADFYVQSEVEYRSRNYIGGEINRHCMWISRVFWRTWFEADRVSLEAARRDYLEYRFGTVLSFNARCRMLGLRIPYYVWVACSQKPVSSQNMLAHVNAQATESPFLTALDLRSKNLQAFSEISALEIRSKAYDSAVVNLAASLPLPASWYQHHHWRIYYDEGLEKHRQFGDEYIYAFTWEDAKEDARLLNIKGDDVILAITSAGDNILAYALEQPKRIHAVDLNPNQNHLLELKLAAFTALGHADVWKLFGEGKHQSFREILVSKLSPHLSSLAFQYWLLHGPKTFSGRGLYATGGSRHAINLVRWLCSLSRVSKQVQQMCRAETLIAQRNIWQNSVRKVLLDEWVSWAIISNKTWLWKALGVPQAQREMIEHDYLTQKALETSSPSPIRNSGQAIWNYAVQTFDPVIRHTLLSTQNHYYLVCLLGRYTKDCHPSYLEARAHRMLSRPGAFDNLRIHTDEVREVVARMRPETLTIAVIMDSLDWFEADNKSSREGAEEQVCLLKQARVGGGRVMLRSAGVTPWYIFRFLKIEDSSVKGWR